MPIPALSLAVVGADYPNKRGPTRRFEIEMCRPGESVQLFLEPRNKADENAVAVLSERGVQIGYLTAERAPWIGGMMRQGQEIAAVFQAKATYGAIIRASFDGQPPVLPPEKPKETRSAPEDAFWPDYIPPDD